MLLDWNFLYYVHKTVTIIFVAKKKKNDIIMYGIKIKSVYILTILAKIQEFVRMWDNMKYVSIDGTQFAGKMSMV